MEPLRCLSLAVILSLNSPHFFDHSITFTLFINYHQSSHHCPKKEQSELEMEVT